MNNTTMIRALLLCCPLLLTSCGTVAHYAGQILGMAGSVAAPVTGILRLREGGDASAWKDKADREAKTKHDRRSTQDQRPH